VTEEEYIGIVGEIFDGYTEFDYFGQTAYLKHFSIRDQRYIHRFYDKYKNIAINKGIPTEKEMLEQLREDGLWSDKDDLKISSLEFEVDNLAAAKRDLYLPSQKESYQKSIDEKNQELYRLKTIRKDVMGRTAEEYASSRSNEEFIRYIIYKDADLKDHLFDDDEFSELTDTQITALLLQNQECSRRLGEDNIQHCVLRDFFNMYLSQTEDVSSFYGKPIIHLSIFQLKLALYARIFFNIFQYNEDLPENMKKDPAAILRFSESKRAGKSSDSKSKNSDSGATAVFGATRDDLDFVDPNAKKISLNDEISKQGGSLNMEQLMELMG